MVQRSSDVALLAPLPVYFSAFCQFLAGGSDINGYLIYISLVFYGGALVLAVYRDSPTTNYARHFCGGFMVFPAQ